VVGRNSLTDPQRFQRRFLSPTEQNIRWIMRCRSQLRIQDWPEPHEPNPHLHSLRSDFYYILRFTPYFFQVASSLQGFLIKFCIFLISMRAACSVHLVFLIWSPYSYLAKSTNYKSWCCAIVSNFLLLSPPPPPLIGPGILLSSLFSETCNCVLSSGWEISFTPIENIR
jgi:hypothetical protein